MDSNEQMSEQRSDYSIWNEILNDIDAIDKTNAIMKSLMETEELKWFESTKPFIKDIFEAINDSSNNDVAYKKQFIVDFNDKIKDTIDGLGNIVKYCNNAGKFYNDSDFTRFVHDINSLYKGLIATINNFKMTLQNINKLDDNENPNKIKISKEDIENMTNNMKSKQKFFDINDIDQFIDKDDFSKNGASKLIGEQNTSTVNSNSNGLSYMITDGKAVNFISGNPTKEQLNSILKRYPGKLKLYKITEVPTETKTIQQEVTVLK